ncbi:MAG: hypothetical protein GY859_17405 [Desulfobacterales bacterium]|nr:hypothetical protein [Desulfobacterales bacterium]
MARMVTDWRDCFVYLLEIYWENSCRAGSGALRFQRKGGGIAKWTPLPASAKNREILRLMALACGDAGFISRLPFPLGRMCHGYKPPLHLELVATRHSPQDGSGISEPLLRNGLRIDHYDGAAPLDKKECRLSPRAAPFRKIRIGSGNTPMFFLAYGYKLAHKDGTDDFQFNDPCFRVTRFHSLFSENGLLTDPAAFLTRLHHRGVLKARYPAKYTLDQFRRLFEKHLDLDVSRWLKRGPDFKKEWAGLRPFQRRLLLPILDIARHMIDAFPKAGEPLTMPGLLIIHRPDLICGPGLFTRWIRLVDDLLPSMQCVITLPGGAAARLPRGALAKSLVLPRPSEKKRKYSPVPRVPPKGVLLIDVDGHLPNLALMKLGRYFKNRGRQVFLQRMTKEVRRVKGVEEVYAGCVFNLPASMKKLEKLRRWYGDSLEIGGSGVDLSKRLPRAAAALPPDYSLYPDFQDRAIGFITRGCPYNCAFCVVPKKEGKPRQVAELDDLLQDKFTRLILLDDNILAHPDAMRFLEEMADRGVMVNFTQTLDFRKLNRENVSVIRRIHCSNIRFSRKTHHFSLNNARALDMVSRKYRLFGFKSSENAAFICMYGYDTTLAEDVERFRFLRSLPGAYAFVQRYRPGLGAPEPDLADFFDENVDDLLDQLVKIVFTQHMKSMEVYYRWVSRLYAETFGKLHMGLVNAIFRYNHREKRGRYIASLAGVKNERR